MVKVAAASIVRTEGEEAYITIFKNFMGLGGVACAEENFAKVRARCKRGQMRKELCEP